jgi:hypothetical protein
VVTGAFGLYNALQHSGGCTIGFAGSSATVTLQGPGSETYCPILLSSFQVHQEAHFFQFWQQPGGIAVCTASLNGDVVTVRSDPNDAASTAVAQSICSTLPSP